MRTTAHREARVLFEKCQNNSPSIITEAAIAKLPEPVQRYLQYTQISGRAHPAVGGGDSG